jgi:hypothetical protein
MRAIGLWDESAITMIAERDTKRHHHDTRQTQTVPHVLNDNRIISGGSSVVALQEGLHRANSGYVVHWR